MPEVVATWFDQDIENYQINKKINNVRNLQLNLLAAYKHDFITKANVINGSHLIQVYDSIYNQLNLQIAINQSINRFKFKGVIPRKTRFEDLRSPVHWLQLAGLIQKIYPISCNPLHSAQTFIKDNFFKIVPHDIGLFNAKLNHSYENIVLENLNLIKGIIGAIFVANEFKSNYLINEEHPLISWRDSKNNYEIDFLISSEHYGTYPFEVKSGDHTKARSLIKYQKLYKLVYFSVLE